MVIHQSSKRLLSKMITQLNQLAFVSYFSVEPLRRQYPFLKIQSFRNSTSAQNVKVSRSARNEAQKTLFQYLHLTRSLSLTDAEHISKNSPRFVEDLISRISGEKDVAKSLTKFLRYNPINEFEPFLESLGLHPSEVPSVVPSHLMFLSDNYVMLDNFHVLCDYGVPKTNIGRIFKEARGVSDCDHGVLLERLRGYECLGFSSKTVATLVSNCPLLLVGGVNNDFVKIIGKLKGVGLENDWIGGYLDFKKNYQWNRLLETMDFLEKVCCSKEHMCKLLKNNPEFLFEGSGRKVYLLLGRFLKLGLGLNEIYSLFVQYPHILSAKCVENLLRVIDFLFDVELGAKDIANIISSHVEPLSLWSLKRPKTVYKYLGMDKDGLRQILKENPSKVLSLASKKAKSSKRAAYQDPSLQLEKAKFLVSLGYIENSDEMIKAVKQFKGRGDQLQERFDCLVQAGLDRNVATEIIKQAPNVLNQSKEVIQEKIDCLRNCLGYPLEAVVVFPAFLCYDLERINLRFLMYAWLKKKGAAKSTLTLSTILACAEARFVKYFVNVHPEGPEMWKSLKEQPRFSSSVATAHP